MEEVKKFGQLKNYVDTLNTSLQAFIFLPSLYTNKVHAYVSC